MSKSVQWIVLLATGWVLGWMTHHYWPSTGSPRPAGRQIGEVPASPQPGPAGGLPASSRGQPEPAAGTVEFADLLAAHRYPEALQRFNEETSTTVLERYRADLIRHLESLLEDRDYQHADRLLSGYLDSEYRDVEVLLIRARLYQLQGEYPAAIDSLYQARSYEYRMPQIAAITTQIRKTVARYDRQLQAAGQQQALLEVYEQLAVLEPDYSPYFIALAKAQLELDRPAEARRSLALVQFDPLVSNEALQLISRIDNQVRYTQPGPVAIPLLREGEHFVVEAWINDAVPVHLLIDTGASMTVVRSEVLVAAGIPGLDEPPRYFNTANGLVAGTVYRADNLKVGDQVIPDIELAGLDFPMAPGVDGLLGMNYLKHFRFFIDQGKQELRLSEPL
jgi:clan AA aspartic protease (TIGR02281 family)